MGTYCRIVLKASVPDAQVEEINAALYQQGFPIEIHNGVPYGAFHTEAMIQEDVRYMNEDPEGLKQAIGWKRPITVEYLEQNWMFTRRRQFCMKFGGGDEDDSMIRVVSSWARQNRELIDEAQSVYWQEEQLNKRGIVV